MKRKYEVVTTGGWVRDERMRAAFYGVAMRTLATVLVLLATTTAMADTPKYTRPQNVVIPVKLTDRTKPIQPVATPPARPITGDEAMQIEEDTQPIRLEQEAVLAKLVAQTPDSSEDKPDLLFRLAEHYAKQQRFWRLKSLAPAKP
jgi:hypothetical protein